MATYFDTHFQFYGRKLNIEYYNGQGNETNELLGTGQQQADADATRRRNHSTPSPSSTGPPNPMTWRWPDST